MMTARRFLLVVVLLLTGVSFNATMSAPVHAYSNGRLMDDAVFDNTSTMNESQIQAFLASKGPCLANYHDVDPNWNGSAWTYTGSVSAAHIIARAAAEWGINPQVILATLQKEESLITGGIGCGNVVMTSAMGYGCPDGNARYDYPNINVFQTCVSHEGWAGFSRQVWWGSWQLKFNKERSYGNTGWQDNGNITYGGFMTQGTYKRCAATSCAPTFFSGDVTIDGQGVHLETGATASFYTYTPHLGQALPGIFESWFGPTTGGASLTAPLYRLYKRSSDRHFYTVSPTERDSAIRQGYALEGVSFYVSTSGGGNLSAVYRLYNRSTDYHFYTNSQDEANRDTGVGFIIEGTGYLASNGGDPGVSPVYRLLNRGNHMHFFTINASERDQAVASGAYLYEGVAFYAIAP
ncbi:MAG TPA: hypothetical protein VMT30_08780 [Candidatus Saccharimonadia bacterium]|nr:hypothetical protein [Candidatus Saccharimonadia bacterium]